jgi:hypothetical protein
MQQSISLESNFVESLKLEFDTANIKEAIYKLYQAYQELRPSLQLSNQFLLDKEMFNQRFEDIQNGNAVLLSQDDYQNKMSSFVKELETKYADS